MQKISSPHSSLFEIRNRGPVADVRRKRNTSVFSNSIRRYVCFGFLAFPHAKSSSIKHNWK